MASLMLQLGLCVVTVIHLTSSQSTYTYDVVQKENDVNSCRNTDEMLNQLMTTNSQLMTVVLQLQKDVAELKVGSRQKNMRDCPAGFTYLSSVNGGCYKVINENLNWTDAALRCRSLHKDAHLLVINDAAEQSAVAGMLSSTDSTTLNRCFRHSRC